VTDDGALVQLRGEKGTRGGLFVLTVPAAGQGPAGNSPALTFTHADNQYQLSGIWDSTTEGRAIPRG
jgi:hypothetical protein